MRPLNWVISIIFLLSAVGIHYHIERFDTMPLIMTYTNLFVAYIYLIASPTISFRWIMILAITTRLALFFELPNLSDDFYRFIWDGQLVEAGVNPYSATPAQIHDVQPEIAGLNEELYQNLNSKNYHSIYPPFSQFIFWVSGITGEEIVFNQVSIIRILIFSFDLALIALFTLKRFDHTIRLIGVYALNPLVILELTGNLHFEGIVAFFIALSIFYIDRGKWHKSATALALGIVAKFTPLMLLPALIKKIGWRQSILSYSLIALLIAGSFIFFIDAGTIDGLTNSFSLFFKKFEFNAAVFFALREIGIFFYGYDMVQIIGPLLSISALGLIVFYSLTKVNRESNLAQVFTIIFFIQLSLATTVHPWYIIPIIALSTWSGYVFPLVWSYLIFLTYAGYTPVGYEHNLIIIVVEYLVIIPLAIYEMTRNKKWLFKYVKGV